MTIGVFPGKFLPLHRGHIMAILKASTMCDKLYVVVSYNEKETVKLCKNIKPIPLTERFKWVSQELQGFEHIKVIGLDEGNIPVFPDGWKEWADLLTKSVPEKFDIIYGNEESYRENHNKYFPNVEYVTFDCDRTAFNISGTEIRDYPIKNWEYLSGASRPYFCKKVLITGTESCSKTTLTKMLAKVFYTSWSEEVGRYYSKNYLGGNEEVFTKADFERIVFLQHEEDLKAHRTANKVVFHDTDAIITQYYLRQYLGEHSEFIDDFVKTQKYDLILILKPDVKWVADGQRWLSDQKVRDENHRYLLKEYFTKKHDTEIVEITGDYTQRLETTTKLIKNLLKNC